MRCRDEEQKEQLIDAFSYIRRWYEDKINHDDFSEEKCGLEISFPNHTYLVILEFKEVK